jgi:hypothetical protein
MINVKNPRFILITEAVFFLILLTTCSAGCSSIKPTPDTTMSTDEPSQMVLQSSDIPGNFTVKERSVRLVSDVGPSIQNHGYITGYFVSYQKIAKTPISATFIDQIISEYPITNITKILPDRKVGYLNMAKGRFQLIEMSNPNIGDNSQAFSLTDLETNNTYIFIDFVKKNVYEQLVMRGAETDYSTLKDIAKIAAAKIK